MSAQHDLKEFLRDCGKGGMVAVWPSAMDTAREDFTGLNEQADVMRLLKYEIGSRLNWIPPQTEASKSLKSDANMKVDAYEFQYQGKVGYLAICRYPNKKWLVKSFKANHLNDKDSILKNVNKTLREIGHRGTFRLGGMV